MKILNPCFLEATLNASKFLSLLNHPKFQPSPIFVIKACNILWHWYEHWSNYIYFEDVHDLRSSLIKSALDHILHKMSISYFGIWLFWRLPSYFMLKVVSFMKFWKNFLIFYLIHYAYRFRKLNLGKIT
jgi:hypothetical protein